MTGDEIDALLTKLRDFVNAASIGALASQAEAQDAIHQLEQAGFKVRLLVSVSVQRGEVADDRSKRAGAIAAQVRWCPQCSTPEAPFRMKASIVMNRVGGSVERDVIEGAQVRFSCSLCGYGEVEPIK